MSVNPPKYNTPIWPADFIVKDNFLWFFHGKLNAMLRYDLDSGKMEAFGGIPYDKAVVETRIYGMIDCDEDIYLIPEWGHNIAIFNVNIQEYHIIDFPIKDQYYNKITFSSAHLFDGALYCIPYNYPYIIKIDILSEEIYTIFNVREFLDNYDYIDADHINASAIDESGYIYCVFSSNNKVLVFNTESYDIELLSIGSEDSRYSRITYFEGKLYLVDFFSKYNLIVYNINNKEIEWTSKQPYDYFKVLHLHTGSYICDSYYDGKFSIYNEKNEKVMEYNYEKKERKHELDYSYYHGIVKQFGEKDIFIDRNRYEICIINNDNIIEKQIPMQNVDGIINNEKLLGEVIFENGVQTVNWFVDNIKQFN